MKFVLLFFTILLSSYVIVCPLNFTDANVRAKHNDIIRLHKSQFEGHKIAASLTRNPQAGGTIAVSPASIYDNDVAGLVHGIDRTIKVNNTGSGILTLSAITITGANAAEFVLSGLPSLPADINAGDSVSFSVAFNPFSVELKTASINISSNDATSPVTSIPLRGLGTSGLGGANEPSLQSILNLLEIPVITGDDDASTAVINSSTLLQKAPLLGEELNIKHFQKAGSGNVTITPLAVFGPTDSSTVLGMGWYKSGDVSTKSELFTVSNTPLSNGQTVNVNFTGSLFFDPATDTFGFYSRWPFFSNRHLYSEDNLNTFSGSIPHHVRVYPYKNKSGGVVPNAYIIAFEENTSGFDYQDLVFVVKNVKPATPLSNALLFIENPDKFPSDSDFVFSRIQVPWSRDDIIYNANHDSLKVRIHNKGMNPLIISNLRLSNDATWEIEKFDGASYTPGTGLPKTVNSGSYVDVILKFTALNQATRVKVLHETLTVVSNDDKYPSKTIFLHGLWQKSGEGANEPYAQEIIDAFGFKTNTGFGHTDPDLGDSTKLKGDEIKPSYFVRADSSLPVSIRQMSAYHGCCNSTEKIMWYYKGSATLNTVYTHIQDDGQTLFPRKSSTTGASGTFDPITTFGFKIGSNDYTDAAKNPGQKIGIRVWKALDSKGNIIPNSYIISNDYLGTDATNYDYNDNTHFVSNIKPETGSAFFSTLGTTPSALDFGEKFLQTTDSLLLNVKSNGQTYTNGSSDPVITISSVEITGENKSEFSAAMPLSSTLNPQQTSTIKVKFSPLSQGLKIADLLIHYNNSLSPLRVPLYGIAKPTGTSVIVNYRIKSGSSTPITINGKTWSADDQYSFDNLEPYTNTNLSQIAATDEDSLYLTELSSDGDKKPFRYEIPVPNGDYAVRLHFAEIYWGNPGTGLSGGAGSRVMSVKLEGQLRLINFDVTQDVGKAATVIKNFPVTVVDEKLNIDFSATVNRPMVCAVEVYSFLSTPLVNNFLELKGIAINKKVDLEWVVSNGADAKYFEVQRSANNTDFITLGEVASNGAPSQVSKYNFTDNDPEAVNNYYRIKEVDLDGKITYSKIIRIDFSNAFTMQLFPNPAKNKFSIQFADVPGNQKTNLLIQSLSGNIVKKIPLILSGEKIEVDISSLSAGLYIMSISGDNFVIHKKFLKN